MICSHIPQRTEIAEYANGQKITRAPCRKRTGNQEPRAKKFGDLITADHKIFSENCELRNNHWYAVVVQELATQWVHIRAKQNLHRKPKRVYESFSSRQPIQK